MGFGPVPDGRIPKMSAADIGGILDNSKELERLRKDQGRVLMEIKKMHKKLQACRCLRIHFNPVLEPNCCLESDVCRLLDFHGASYLLSKVLRTLSLFLFMSLDLG